MHFGISEGKGGLKHGSRPWLGMDIFWNCPIKETRSKSVSHLPNPGRFYPTENTKEDLMTTED